MPMPYYNQFNPNNYQNYYNQQFQPQIPGNVPANNIIQVSSPNDVETWAIAPGNALTFYIASNPPMIATKTKSQNPLEAPVTKYYDLTERSAKPAEAPKAPGVEYATKDDIKALRAELEALKQHSAFPEDET